MSVSTDHRVATSRDAFARFTAAVLEAFTTPTEAMPTVACVSQATVIERITAVRAGLAGLAGPASGRSSAAALLALLETSQVMNPVPLDGRAGPRFALYGVGPHSRATLDPLELMLAAEPSGVVCYFTALSYHGLTTQLPPHHHVAKLNSGSTFAAAARAVDARDRAPPSANASTRSPYGERRFAYQGIDYYRTARAAHTLAGVQRRQLNDRTIVRITTLEQTLLDTLHRPPSCGGASVIWEAWQTGLPRLDEQRLQLHLETLAEPKLWRRVGYLFDALEHYPATDLRAALDRARHEVATQPDLPVAPLFPGLPAVSVDPAWRLAVP